MRLSTITKPISEPCEEGTYRDSTTTFCINCGAGKQSTSDNSDCGKGQNKPVFLKIVKVITEISDRYFLGIFR